MSINAYALGNPGRNFFEKVERSGSFVHIIVDKLSTVKRVLIES